MIQEDKKLLLKDLCARVPYHPKGRVVNACNGAECDEWLTCATFPMFTNVTNNCRLYLRPMSSMTEEEKEQFYYHILDLDIDDIKEENGGRLPLPFANNGAGLYLENFYISDMHHAIDWLNEHHFDYRGLIEKGLALEATEGMYN